MIEYGVITFSSTHTAILAERHLKGKFSVLLMPTLRGLAATCGISIRFRPADLHAIALEMATLTLPPDSYCVYGVHHDGRIDAGGTGEREK